MTDFINRANEELFWVMNRSLGDGFDYLMIFITLTGYTISAFLIAVVAMKFYGGLNKRNVYLLVIALLFGALIVHGMKSVYVKDRPLRYFGEKSQELRMKVNAPFRQLHHRTFPSGHSQTAFGVAVFLILVFGKHKALWFCWAALIAVSRVSLGVHFPLDILFGSLIGAFAAFLTFEIARRRGLLHR